MDDEAMSRDAVSAERVEQANRMLRAYCPAGSTIYGILRSAYPSGNKLIDFYAIVDGTPRWLSGYLSVLLCYTLKEAHARQEGIVVKGYGMDSCVDVAQHLSMALYDDYKQIEGRWL